MDPAIGYLSRPPSVTEAPPLPLSGSPPGPWKSPEGYTSFSPAPPFTSQTVTPGEKGPRLSHAQLDPQYLEQRLAQSRHSTDLDGWHIHAGFRLPEVRTAPGEAPSPCAWLPVLTAAQGSS